MTGAAPEDPARRHQRGRSFGAVAAGYAALRPGYPADVVGFLLGDRPLRVLDLGAGTGLLTGVLRAAGHEVVAVDPAAEMLAQLAERLPAVESAVGTAEAIPLRDGAVDAVVAGQAAHWFDPEPAAAEIRRVLRPGGVLGLVWNTRDERVPWVGALGEVLAVESRNHAEDERVVAALAGALRADVAGVDSAVTQRLSPDEVVGGIATRSYVATMTPARREEFLGRVRAVLDTHDGTRGRAELELPYVTRGYRLIPG